MSCRKCEQCKSERMRKWIGKVQAEGQTCDNMWMVTLTYADSDSDDSIVLNYRPVQRFFKRLRQQGYQFRYFIVGEYGGEKSRSHWHAIIFWEGATPEAEFSKDQYIWPYWPEGYSYVEEVEDITYCGTYVAKYLMKDHKAKVRASTNPMLGENYLMEYARKRATDGQPLFGKYVTYTTGAHAKNGDLFHYHLDKASGLPSRMAYAYLQQWAISRPNQALQYHPNTQEYFDEIALDYDKEDPSFYAIDQFLSRHYDYEIASVKTVVETYPFGWTAIYHPTYFVIQKTNQYGVHVWQATLEREKVLDASPDENLRRRALNVMLKAPEWLRRETGCTSYLKDVLLNSRRSLIPQRRGFGGGQNHFLPRNLNAKNPKPTNQQPASRDL